MPCKCTRLYRWAARRDDGVLSARVTGTQVVIREGNPALAMHRQALVAVRGPDAGSRWAVDSPHAVVGSDPGADITLSDDTVSGRHCELGVRQERYVVRDLQSTNGTLVDGVEVLEAYVQHGSVLQLGETELRFEPEVRWVVMPEQAVTAFGALVGTSPAMQQLYSVLQSVADTPLSILIEGETGTGKEIASRSIHSASARRKGPFVVLDCGAVSPTLIESELFGHEQGAFTGADRARAGCFEQAQGGTVLIDEIGELPLELQPKLLGVLERHELRRLGGNQSIDVDVRVIAATHRDLHELVQAGRFREDLYFRLAEVVVRLPSLSERSTDIPILARSILQEESGRSGLDAQMSRDAETWLQSRAFPGNVRELRSLLRRALALGPGPGLNVDSLREADRLVDHRLRASVEISSHSIPVGDERPIKQAREQWLQHLEPRYLESVLDRFGEDLDAAAHHVGMHRKSLLRLLKQHGLERPSGADD